MPDFGVADIKDERTRLLLEIAEEAGLKMKPDGSMTAVLFLGLGKIIADLMAEIQILKVERRFR